MVIVHQLRSGGHRYYLAAVGAPGGPGEVPGRWLGRAAASLGLGDEVDGEQLGALLPSGPGRVPAYDVTFAAPKSVSVLHGLGDPATVDAVTAAHDLAVTAGVAYLEDHAARVRDGRGWIDADGLAVAAFRHRVSRAGDPHLHTHAVVANRAMAGDADGRAIDGSVLRRERTGAAALYHATLRHELTRSIGLTWDRPIAGRADCREVPATVRAVFSQRRAAVLAAAPDPAERKWAERVTRPPREGLVDIDAARVEWRRRAVAVGWVAGAYVGRAPRAAPLHIVEAPVSDRFGRSDVLTALAGQARDGAPAAALRLRADAILASATPIAPGRYTTVAAHLRRSEVERQLEPAGGWDDHPRSVARLREAVEGRGGRLLLIGVDDRAAAALGDRVGAVAVGARSAEAAIAGLGLGPLDAVAIVGWRRMDSADLAPAMAAARAHAIDVVAPAHHRARDVPVGLTDRASAQLDPVGAAAVADWATARAAGRAAQLVVAPAEVAEFNAAARQHLRGAGVLTGIEVGGLAAGDTIRFAHARPKLGITRHATADVVAVRSDAVDVHIGSRQLVFAPADLRTVVHGHAVPPAAASRGESFVVGGHRLSGGPIHRYITPPEHRLELDHGRDIARGFELSR